MCIELVEELDWLKSVSSQVMEEQATSQFSDYWGQEKGSFRGQEKQG